MERRERGHLDNVLIVFFGQFFGKINVRSCVPVIEHVKPDIFVMQPADAKSLLEAFSRGFRADSFRAPARA